MPPGALDIDGQAALVTGAGQGIGRAIAGQLCDYGIDVALNDVKASRLDEATGELASGEGAAIGVVGDVSDPAAVQTMLETTVDELGGLDIVVNNVGISGPSKPVEELTFDEFMNTVAVNLGGTFNVTSKAVPYLRQSSDGRIVNIASIRGKQPLPYKLGYATSKIGVIGMTRTVAVELADDGINVNAICPGPVKGPRWNEVLREQAEASVQSVEAVADEFRKDAPMETFIEPDDVADMALLLCSDRTAMMTGQDVNVDGGTIMY